MLTKNVKAFSLERKLSDHAKHEIIQVLWKYHILDEFCRFIYKKEHFSYLNSKNILHQKVLDIAWTFIAENENNYENLRENLRRNKYIFQFVYSIFYPEIYCLTGKRGFDWKVNFWLHLKNIRTKKIGWRSKTFRKQKKCKFWRKKTILIDDFTKEEEEELRKKVETRKQKRRTVPEKIKNLNEK